MSIYGAAQNGLYIHGLYNSAKNFQAASLGLEVKDATPENVAQLRARLEQLVVDISFANKIEDIIKKAITQLQV